MDRRTFLRLTGVAGAFLRPLLAEALQGPVVDYVPWFAHLGANRASDRKREGQGCVNGIVIKVIGIGGGGMAAVDCMIREGFRCAEFIAVGTSALELNRSSAETRLQLGQNGLSANALPLAGRSAAMEARKFVARSLHGTHILLVAAGMGGGTGSAAAPIVAEIAQELGILTVAVVTKPFAFEGERLKIAKTGIAELQKHVDSLIVIQSDKLLDTLGDDVSMDEAFKAADDVLCVAIRGIAEIASPSGLVNACFKDVRIVFEKMGTAMLGTAEASGADRARIAAEQAIASYHLEGINLSRAAGVLVSITSSPGLQMEEVNVVMKIIREFAGDEAVVTVGVVHDGRLEDEICVTVIATGLDRLPRRSPVLEPVPYEYTNGKFPDDVAALTRQRPTLPRHAPTATRKRPVPRLVWSQQDATSG